MCRLVLQLFLGFIYELLGILVVRDNEIYKGVREYIYIKDYMNVLEYLLFLKVKRFFIMVSN